jgi:anti-sigma B factor antagonist
MEIRERTVDAAVVLDLSGKLVAGEDTALLRDKVNSLVFQGRRTILLNLAGLSYIDSTGLGELVTAHTTLTKRGGRVALANLTQRVEDLLVICRLSTVFDIFESEADALQSLAGSVASEAMSDPHAAT